MDVDCRRPPNERTLITETTARGARIGGEYYSDLIRDAAGEKSGRRVKKAKKKTGENRTTTRAFDKCGAERAE